MNIPYVFKKCTACGKWLVANKINFYKRKNGKYGLRSQCKKCENKSSKQWYKDNQEYKKECVKQWYKDNQEYRKEYNRQWNENNQEYRKKYYEQWHENNQEYNKQWYKDNKEYKKEYNKQWYKDNEEHCKEYNKQWRENNKEYYKKKGKQWRENNQEKCFNYSNKRRQKEINQGRGITKEQWKEMFDFFNWKCAYSDINLGYKENRSVDHILALDNGGLNEIWNLVPMYRNYNSSKHKRIDVINWYMEQEYYSEDRLNKIVEWQIYAFNKWATEEHELILITDLFEE